MMNVVSQVLSVVLVISCTVSLGQEIYHHHHFDDGSKSITHHESSRSHHHHHSSHSSTPFHHSHHHNHHSNHHALSLITSLLSFARNILTHAPGHHISLFKAPADDSYSDASKVPHYFHYHEHLDLSAHEEPHYSHQAPKYEDEETGGGHHSDGGGGGGGHSEHHDDSSKQEHHEYTHTDDVDSDDAGHYASTIVTNNMAHSDTDKRTRGDYLNAILSSVKATRVHISPVNDTKYSDEKSSSSTTDPPSDQVVSQSPPFLPLPKAHVGQVIEDKPRPDYYINYYKQKDTSHNKVQSSEQLSSGNETNVRETLPHKSMQVSYTGSPRHQQKLHTPSSVYEEESPPNFNSLVSLMHQRTPIQTDTQSAQRFESSRINTVYPTRGRMNNLKRGNYSSSHNTSISSLTSG